MHGILHWNGVMPGSLYAKRLLHSILLTGFCGWRTRIQKSRDFQSIRNHERRRKNKE
ncbi:hypothetical protein IHE45_08G028700 [Dioscorea alata]|uniref:Uncharacterized protein n=1 Tax=Dioscorea alata TaxID=55571 RepID=A0ACB7VIC4_DIOAL|nr:hypothetical protein IHE45_08G028700 [Dioscorea alata]